MADVTSAIWELTHGTSMPNELLKLTAAPQGDL